MDQKYDLIEDLEHEIDRTDEQVKSAKNELEYQRNVIANKDRMITELNGMRLEVEEKCSKLEDDLFIQNGVIEKLKDDLTEKNDAVTQDKELLQLSSEVRTLKDVNAKKEMELQNISKEHQEMKAKLEEIESESLRFKEKSLKDELSEQFGTIVKCKECDEKFGSPASLKIHMKSVHGEKVRMRLHKLEKQILEQRLDLTIKISQLKEKESSERQTCRCIGWCAISHQKLSWKKSPIKECCTKFQKLTYYFLMDSKNAIFVK